jgi:hypothetical protein
MLRSTRAEACPLDQGVVDALPVGDRTGFVDHRSRAFTPAMGGYCTAEKPRNISSLRRGRLDCFRVAGPQRRMSRRSSQFVVRCLTTCAPGCCGLLDFDRYRQKLSFGLTVMPARFAEQQCRDDRCHANCRHDRENGEKTKHISCSYSGRPWPLSRRRLARGSIRRLRRDLLDAGRSRCRYG